jgi:MoCo/4Fe-4S cofactor protein with predicted Tat translocation signal
MSDRDAFPKTDAALRIVEVPEAPDLAEAPTAGRPRRIDGGPLFWRSLDELEGTAEFEHFLHREFPEQASEWLDPVGRRRFLQLMGASMALAGVGAGCVVHPQETIVPYVRQPEQVVPGRPAFYATAAVHDGYGVGVLAESHMGRPTKLEGNPTHPASLGATDAFTQAAILTLYDPDRSQVVLRNGRVSTWDNFLDALIGVRAAQLGRRGAGLRIVSGTITSPTLARLIGGLFDDRLFPEARWIVHDPVGDASAREGARLAFGREVETIAEMREADVIVALDADFLAWGPGRLRDARAFTERREPGATPNRLYVVESSPTITGTMADHRWPLRPSEITALTVSLARALGVPNLPKGGPAYDAPWLRAVADDLAASRGRCLVLAGETLPPAAHALAHAINAHLGNVGKTVAYREAVAARPPEGRGGTLTDLAREIDAGAVETLVVLGGNPAYDAPADLGFTDTYMKVPTRIHLGLYADETARRSTWHVPEAHWLESWGDVRAFDGTATIQQPLIAPLYGGRTAAELISALLEGTPRPARELVEENWRGDCSAAEFEAFRTKALIDGVVPDSAAPPLSPALHTLADLRLPEAAGGDFEMLFRPDPSVWDGRYSNNGWLQELPKPLTKLTWDNAALVSPASARALGVATGDRVALDYRGRVLEAAALVVPGHADGAIMLTLGYGRTAAGRVGNDAGFNAYALRTAEAPWGSPGLTVRKLGGTAPLATTQVHWNIPDPNVEATRRNLIRVGTIKEYQRNPAFAQAEHTEPAEPGPEAGHDEAGPRHGDEPRLTLYEYPEPMRRRTPVLDAESGVVRPGAGNAWGMAINLNTCIGCNACVVACVAENNIPVVGKDQVLRGREMQWLRIDRYYQTTESNRPAVNPRAHFQPMLCQHCEFAPCELVCPVAATTHSAEGLNEMTYNRCVGTRYCSNNCPYKVRRFNFFQYADETTPSYKLMRNPDVTVRTRGVMEKCTYCVQRINGARIAAEIENGRDFVAGDAVQTACQQACPTRAIVFGNLNDPGASVVAAKADPRNYGVLAELNTRPRTTYLAKLINPNPAIEA